MAEEPNVEAEGAGEVAAPPVSSEAVTGDANQLSELVKQVLAEELKPIKGDISGLYSRQDKDRNQFREFMDEFKKQKASGLSDAEAEQAAQNALRAREKADKRDQLIDKLAEKFLNEPSTQSPGTGASGAGALAQVIRNNKLDANDPAVAKILAENQGNDLNAALALGRYAASASRQPDPSASTSMNTGSGVSEPDVEKLTIEYQQKMREARGNRTEIKRLRDEYAQKGVNIYGIDFS